MSRVLICDFGGVLTSPLEAGFLAYQEESGLTLAELGQAMARAAEEHGDHPLFQLERGEITEAEFRARIEAQLEQDFDLERLIALSIKQVEPNAPMIELVRELRADGVRTALLTNNVREWESLWRSETIDELFEVVVVSASVGMRKPDPAIYRLTLERLDGSVSPEDCVFVDDLDVNCEAARGLGMTAVRFTDAEQAIPEIRSALAE
jgi:putative hydrolase of the HAD superfamily